MLPVSPYYLVPFVALTGAANAASYFVWLLLTGVYSLQVIRYYLLLSVAKFKPHSYAIRGRATFNL